MRGLTSLMQPLVSWENSCSKFLAPARYKPPGSSLRVIPILTGSVIIVVLLFLLCYSYIVCTILIGLSQSLDFGFAPFQAALVIRGQEHPASLGRVLEQLLLKDASCIPGLTCSVQGSGFTVGF